MRNLNRVIKVRHSDGNDYSKTVTVPKFDTLAEAREHFWSDTEVLEILNAEAERRIVKRERVTMVFDLNRTGHHG